MADKGKKGKPGPAPAPGTAPAAAEPAPAVAKTEEKKEEKPKSVQPKDEVGTRKGCRRYRWEFKDSNREFWVMGHAEVKILSLVSWAGVPGQGPKDGKREKELVPGGSRGAPERLSFGSGSGACLPAGLPNRFADNVHRHHCAPSPDTHHHHGVVHLLLLHHCLHFRHPEIHALHPVANFCK